MTESVFSLHSISKNFGYHKVLREVSFEVPEGEFILLLGNNGAGKSTLMRILSTLMRPSSGKLHYRGESVHDAGEKARANLGVISHESRFYPDLTARENLRVFGSLYGVEGKPDNLNQCLAEVRLDDVPDVPVRAFSSGMLKRLAIARLLLYEPGVLLLDEPYSGLDQASISMLDEYLDGYRKKGGTTIMVTHQFTAGVSLADRIVLLHQGRLMYNQQEKAVTAGHCAQLLQAYGTQSATAKHNG